MENDGPRPRVIVAAREAWARRAARQIATAMRGAVADRGRCTVALAGGDTPRPVYAALAEAQAQEPLPWPAVDVFFGDERAVPPDNPESNFRMAMDTLLGPVAVDPLRVQRMHADAADPEAAARAYEAVLPEVLDVLLLGMGEDGHTASLFPGAEPTAGRRVIAVQSPKPPLRRLTITPLVIVAARRTFVLATGAAKAGTVRRALEGPYDPALLPVQLARQGTWILDEGAASQLTTVPSEQS